MAAAAVERPTTAQERVLAFNKPPPPPPCPAEPTHRQRAAQNNRGTGVAVAFDRAAAIAATPSEDTQSGSRRTKQSNSFDIFLGPKGAGHPRHGVRRFEEKCDSMVGKALTDEWIRGRKEDDPLPKAMVRARGPKDNLEGVCCNILTEEAKHRPQRAAGLVAPPHTAVAPYSEPELPPQPIPAENPSGKRRFKKQDNGDILCTMSPELYGSVNGGTHGNKRMYRNKANESHDVLNLGQYTSEELNEVERNIVRGPREFIPPPLPPRQRPIIARLKSNANMTHDIFGTGQGVDEVEPIHGKNRGASAPRRTGDVDVLNPVPEEQTPPKAYHMSDLLAYYSPSTPKRDFLAADVSECGSASAGAGARQPEAKVPSGMLFVSKSDCAEARSGRARGLYVPKNNVILI